MPLYEYYCDVCDNLFEALRPFAVSGKPAPCPKCGVEADRIMPTSFASMARTQGWKQRVPYHHHSVRGEQPKPTIARVTPKGLSKGVAPAKSKRQTGAKKK
jgi:putative FmdB family regulatory protein